MPNCRNIEFYITNAPPSAAAQRKNKVLERWKEKQSDEPTSTCLVPAESAHTCVLAHTLCVGVFLCACVCLLDSPSERLVVPHWRAHCVCFFSLTPDSQPLCDPMLIFDWPETVNLKARKEDRVVVGRVGESSYYGLPILTTSSWSNTHSKTHAFTQTCMGAVRIKYWGIGKKYT